jgi:outer membrane protein assembly factor BamB
MGHHIGLVVVLSILGLTVAAGGTPKAAGQQVWASRYDGPGHGVDDPQAVVPSPDGTRVFVTGRSAGLNGADDFVTAAYAASDGSELWVARYDGPAHDRDLANAIAVSPDGTRVFVTGGSYGAPEDSDFATVAYDATTGEQLWLQRYAGPNGYDGAGDVAVSPDGSTVFVTGDSTGITTNIDVGTIAYRADTGRQLWAQRYNGPGNHWDFGTAVVVAPGGSKVFVTSSSMGRNLDTDFATVAYSAVTGTQLWVSRLAGPCDDWVAAIAVSPGGARVFVTGHRPGAYCQASHFATVAYSASSGQQLWERDSTETFDYAEDVAVAPGGKRVFVTGTDGDSDYETVAYDAAGGSRVWTSFYDGPGHSYDAANSVAVSPGGTKVYVTGESVAESYDFGTVAYAAATGAQLWVGRYDGTGHGTDICLSVAVAPGGRKVFVTGRSPGPDGLDDYATVSYRA